MSIGALPLSIFVGVPTTSEVVIVSLWIGFHFQVVLRQWVTMDVDIDEETLMYFGWDTMVVGFCLGTQIQEFPSKYF